MPGRIAVPLRGRIRQGAVLLGAARSTEQTAPRVYAARSPGARADVQGVRSGVLPALCLPRLGVRQPAAAHLRGGAQVRLAQPAETGAPRVTLGAWKPGNRIPLISAVMLGGVVVVLAMHRDQAHAVWTSLTGVSPSLLALVLLLVFCQLGLQAVRLWTILPRDVALTPVPPPYPFTLAHSLT